MENKQLNDDGGPGAALWLILIIAAIVIIFSPLLVRKCSPEESNNVKVTYIETLPERGSYDPALDRGLTMYDSAQALCDTTLIESWYDCIHNPENQPFLLEISFNLGIPIDSVTQEMFNERYL